jgi:hypothetical protein
VADYGVFMECATLGSGPAVAITGEGCATRDLDGDGDIDLDDFGIFQRCFTGQDIPGNPDCSK